MTISRAKMYRQLYQMGGIGTLPMDFGQPLQVSQPISNPMLNYGETPLTMAGGGIMRLGYQEGDMAMIEDQAMMQPQMQDQGMMQPQMMEPPLKRMQVQQPNIKDPQQALEIIIQMLIAQGIPPEQAREIALQMIQAVAEGGMEEMEDQRVEARFGGSINGRAQYGLGSIFKGAAKAVSSVVSGVTDAVKSVVKSDLGKAALTVAAIYAAGGGSFFNYTPFPGTTPGFALANLPGGSFLVGTSAGDVASSGTRGFIGQGGLFDLGAGTLFSGVSSLLPSANTLKTFGLGALTGKLLGGGEPEQQIGESTADYQARVNQYKAQYAPLLNPTIQYPNNPFYPQTQMAADGGRIGYQAGGIGDLISQITKQEFFGIPAMAMGGEVPTRKNQAGITELDYRETGGFVPPIGIKEKADDIPAMLSNNEFVFTADAVRNAGDGDINRGAERMYSLMKNLENGGSV
jgi:hypothetical protein